MFRQSGIYLITFLMLFTFTLAQAANDKELRKQRSDAQKERRALVKERDIEQREAKNDFREYVRELEKDYREQARDIDTEFQLQEVELKAEHDKRVAEADAAFQKKLSELFTSRGAKFDQQTMEKLQADAKVHSDELFRIKKQSAQEVYNAKKANTQRKNELFSERDRMLLERASDLGLTKQYEPVKATPIGDGLTKSEERWNKSEEKKVARLIEGNRKTLGKYRNGDALRNWEMQTADEDFELTWKEKSELHEIDSQATFYNALFLMPMTQGGQVDQQSFMARITENEKKKKMIKIEYKKTRDQNRIKRRKEKKEIQNK